MTQAEHILARFGGVRPLAAKLCLPPTTVQWWRDHELIPPRHWPAILKAGAALTPPLRREEFVEHLPATGNAN